MTSLRRSGKTLGKLLLSGVVLFLLGSLLSPLHRAGEVLRNPFGFSSRVTPSGPVVLMEMQKLARLETGKYNGQAVVTGETSGVLPTFVAGDRLVFIGHGEVVAGIDLSELKQGDIEVNGESARVHLPTAQVFHVRLDNAQSEVFERQTGFLSRPDRDLETRTRIEAENRLRDAALQKGLLETAQRNAQDAIRQQLEIMGLKDVSFV
jgi:hypothetical protein